MADRPRPPNNEGHDQTQPGEYFGDTIWERTLSGLRLTLSTYEPCRTQPWHRHVHPTFFLLLAGSHRDHTKRGTHNQAPYTLVFHPSSTAHAGELGRGKVRGLNIEYEPRWLLRHHLAESDLRDYRAFHSALARLVSLRFLATAFQRAARVEAELEMLAFELLLPLVQGETRDKSVPRWFPRVESFLDAHFRDSISLRDVAREAGIHPVYLARVFRRVKGSNLSEHLRSLRLAEAAHLVLQGESLASAAHAAGFADQAHFCRSCATAFGFSPKGLWPARQALQR
jgi:AraC family transcriptional regulator